MPDPLDALSQSELLALALDASQRNETGLALTYLKESASRPDTTAPALFMLGSEYAQLGLMEEAKASMARAVACGADFPLARFQLGMLHMTSGDLQAANAIWEPLAALDATHPQAYLASFQRGLRFLVADEFQAALQALHEGIHLNHDNEPLNGDMRRMIDSIERLLNRDGSAAATATLPAAPPSAEADFEPGHLFISAYGKPGKPH